MSESTNIIRFVLENSADITFFSVSSFGKKKGAEKEEGSNPALGRKKKHICFFKLASK